jgi:hypothetical protein
MRFRNFFLLKSYILRIPTVDCATRRNVDVVTLVLYSINVSFLRIRAVSNQDAYL